MRQERGQAAALRWVPGRVVLQPRVPGPRCTTGPLRRQLPPRRRSTYGQGGQCPGSAARAGRHRAEHHRAGRGLDVAGARCQHVSRMWQKRRQTAALRWVPGRLVLQPRVSGPRRKTGPLRRQLPPRRRSTYNHGGRGGTARARRRRAENHRAGRGLDIAGARCQHVPRMWQERRQTAAMRPVQGRVVLQPQMPGCRSKGARPQGRQLPPRRRSTETRLPGKRALSLCSSIATLRADGGQTAGRAF